MASRQRGRERPRFAHALFIVGVVVCGSALWGGLEYYVLPLHERPFSPLHSLYAPTGLIGQGLGIIGTVMIGAGVALYMLRKRVPVLARFGTLKAWLHLHIFLCLVGPFLVLLHTTFKFGGLVAISFWSMTAVVLSGLFGRYIYVWIPKTMNGRFLSAEEIRSRMRTLLEGFDDRVSLTPADVQAILRPESSRAEPGPFRPELASEAERGIVAAIGDSVRFRFGRRKERARYHRELSAAGVPTLIRAQVVQALEEQRRIERQLELLTPFRRAFRYWHAFHLPLAILMLLVLLVHVGVAVAFGYTWIF